MNLQSKRGPQCNVCYSYHYISNVSLRVGIWANFYSLHATEAAPEMLQLSSWGSSAVLMLISGFYFNLWYRSGIDFCQHLLWCLYVLLHFIWLLTIVFIYAAFRLYWLVKLRLLLMSSLNSRRYVVWFENIKTKPKYNHCKLSIVHNINSVVLPFLNIN